MLMGDRGKFIAMIAGVFFSALIITQQSSIFVGFISRSFGFLTDIQLPDLWVVDPKVQFIDDTKPMSQTKLSNVRGVAGVEWAVPMYKGLQRVRLSNGTIQNSFVVGLDDASLIGGPPVMLNGKLSDLRRSESVIVDEAGALKRLANPSVLINGKPKPLEIGDTIELNDHRAVVVGISRITRTFQSQPVIYTTYSRALTFAPYERRQLTYILVKAKAGESIDTIKARITKSTGLMPLTRDEFIKLSYMYIFKNTGIPINFGIAVILGFIVGSAIVGQTFYSFTLDNIKSFGTFKAMGALNRTLLKMVLIQATIVAFIGYGLGVGAASLFRILSLNSELAFRMIWQIPILTAVSVFLMCLLAATICMIKVFRIEPAIVFRS